MPAVTLVAGEPEIVGALLAAAFTVIENAGNDAESDPSLTVMTMLLKVRTCVVPGVPESLPVEVLNEAQEGRLLTLNTRVWPSGSEADGMNE